MYRIGTPLFALALIGLSGAAAAQQHGVTDGVPEVVTTDTDTRANPDAVASVADPRGDRVPVVVAPIGPAQRTRGLTPAPRPMTRAFVIPWQTGVYQ